MNRQKPAVTEKCPIGQMGKEAMVRKEKDSTVQSALRRQEALAWGENALRDARIADWKSDSWILYEYVTGMSRAKFLAESTQMMPRKEWERYQSLVQRRKKHIPVQHLTGEQQFMGLSFLVNEHVLIPRMDTEILAEQAEHYVKERMRRLEMSKEETAPKLQVLDVCTGSGCIAISLKKRNKNLCMTAVDISVQALQVAKENARRHGVEIRFEQSDLFGVFKQSEKYAQLPQFDLIVSNPPYIPSAVVDELEEEVRLHEPRLALDGTEDGLEFYKKITGQGGAFLKENGMLFFEIGHDQAEKVSRLLEETGFDQICVIKDLAGLDRVVCGIWRKKKCLIG